MQQYNENVKVFYLKRTFEDNKIMLEDFGSIDTIWTRELNEDTGDVRLQMPIPPLQF